MEFCFYFFFDLSIEGKVFPIKCSFKILNFYYLFNFNNNKKNILEFWIIANLAIYGCRSLYDRFKVRIL
jgi:hypothetical protein